MTATPHGCVQTRWDALATRHDATLACPRPDASYEERATLALTRPRPRR